MKTAEELSTMSLAEVRAFRDDTYRRHSRNLTKGGQVNYPLYIKERDHLDVYYQERRVSEGAVPELELEFRSIVKDARARMGAELNLAYEALSRAEDISDETGIPLDAGISPLSQRYIPANSKFAELDEDVCEEFDVFFEHEYGGSGGWQHSAVC